MPEPRIIENTKTSKADLVAALKESIAACDTVLAANDAEFAVATKLLGADTNRFAFVGFIVAHNRVH